ncbi:MAG: glycosyltransferase family 4 protein [Patescibacteria group bacterium]
MRLLIVTQKVDKNDDVLGFFHRWILEFAKNCENVVVICLKKGEHDLPENVKVLSLGKEKGESRFKYIRRFFRHIWTERGNYNDVFVHMNQEYVLLGGLIWRILGKKVVLWRNHKYGNFWTKLAVLGAHRVLFTSPFSYTARFKKSKQMPVGINTSVFRRMDIERKNRSILSLGRISPVKKPDLLIKAVNQMDNVILNIVGAPTENDQDFFDLLKKEAGQQINFLGSIENDKTIDLYNSHELFVNLTPSGSFDKTILEAMACESLVLVANQSLKGAIPDSFLFNVDDPVDLAKKIEEVLSLSKEEKEKFEKQFRNYVVENHDLKKLVHEIFKIFA